MVGYASTGTGLAAFVWRAGVLTFLNGEPAMNGARARAINNHSQISGEANGLGPYHAFIFDDGLQWLPEPDFVNGWGMDLNDHAIVAGVAATGFNPNAPGFHWFAVVWDGPSVHTVHPSSDYQRARSKQVNNAGRMVGHFQSTGLPLGFVFQDGVTYALEGSITNGVRVSIPAAINGHGQIACKDSSVGQIVLTPVWKPGDLKAPATGDLRLRPASAAVNAGSTPLIALDWTDINDANGFVEPMPWDLAVLHRKIGANVDMGAHEHCIGDITGDNWTDINDLTEFLGCYGFPNCALPRPTCCLADFNEDGVIAGIFCAIAQESEPEAQARAFCDDPRLRFGRGLAAEFATTPVRGRNWRRPDADAPQTAPVPDVR